MKLMASKVPLASGEKIIAGYRISLAKLDVEKSGFAEGDELEVKYEDEKIIITKRKR